MNLHNYLAPRGKKGVWQLRMPIPRPLQAAYGRRERVQSLGTTDRQAASRLAVPILADWQKQLDDWRRDREIDTRSTARQPSPSDLAHLPAVLFDGILSKLADARQSVAVDGKAYDAHLSDRERQLQRMIRQYHGGDLAQWEGVAERALETRGMVLADHPGRDALVKGLAEAGIDAWSVSIRQAQGELRAEPKSASVVAAKASLHDTAAAGQTILEIFDGYAAHCLDVETKRSDTLNQDRKVIEQFADFVGANRAIASIKPEDVRDYRNTMRLLPPKWRDRSDMRGLTMREAASKARAAGMPQVALTTINKHLSTISPLFAWLIEERLDLVNPCSGLFYKKVKGKNPRPPFGNERLNAILTSPLFTGFEADGKEHLPGDAHADDWRYWIPFLCLFSGMRVGEAAQLRTEDVSWHVLSPVVAADEAKKIDAREEVGAWVIDVHHNPAKGQTTKSGESRAAVPHAKLVELGFIEFVEKRREAGGDSRLFPELVANGRDQLGAEPSAFWRDYLTRRKIKAGADGLGAHSFRHELADRLREEVGLVDDQIAVALGHDQKSTTAGYGVVRQGTVRFLAPVMAQVRFDKVDFSHLVPAPR